MYRFDGKTLLSASDLVAFGECEKLTQLDLRSLSDAELRDERCKDDDQAQLIQRKGQEFGSWRTRSS